MHSTVRPLFARYGFTGTVFLVSGQIGLESNWEGQNGDVAAPLLSWKEIRELIRSGFSFGSHTVTHSRLPTLDDEEVQCEVQESKKVLEDGLGREIKLFCYPYSDYDVRVQEIVAKAGYVAACGDNRGSWGIFNLWRATCLGSDSMLSFALKARGLYHRYIWFLKHLRRG